MAAFAAVALASSARSPALTKKPLRFEVVAHGTTLVDELDKRNANLFAFVHRDFPFAEGMVQTFTLGERTRAAVDAIDFRSHVAVFIVARRDLRPLRFTVHRLGAGKFELCTHVRTVGPSVKPQYVYTVVSVKMPRDYARAVQRQDLVGAVMLEGKRTLYPKPLQIFRPALCF